MFFKRVPTSIYSVTDFNALRELLRSPANAATISRIATQHGFEELGRFSQYYQRMYGELPSATLKT